MLDTLATTLHDLAFYFLAMWTVVVGAGLLLTGLAPLWRRLSTRYELSLPDAPRPTPPTR